MVAVAAGSEWGEVRGIGQGGGGGCRDGGSSAIVEAVAL